ncbi:MAG: alkaline phosphatase [Bacteroidales bacterium]|nr:alkaline phosphatase [Bacteroidales bacterium]
MNFFKPSINIRLIIFCFSLIVSVRSFSQFQPLGDVQVPKNVIVMIADGMGFNHLKATYYYLYGTEDSSIFKKNNFVCLAQATYPAQLKRDGDTVWASGYNVREVNANPSRFRKGFTDSGAAGTALATGRKTYNGSIGIGIDNDTLINLTEAAKSLRKMTGVISSVPISHATPASFVTHNSERDNYEQIAIDMLLYSNLDLIMGAGNPDFDKNGQLANSSAKYIGGSDIWNQLKRTPPPSVIDNAGSRVELLDRNGSPNPWTLIQDSADFAALLNENPPRRVLGIPKVYKTLQQERSLMLNNNLPFQTPFNPNLPTLDLMARGALNVLSQNPEGFFLMIEGGAVDWAAHGNQSGRMIEEMSDFLNTVKSVISWVETESSWDETLLIVTADHETGFLLGKGGADKRMPIVNNGKSMLPHMKWYSFDHTNNLVPFFAKGAVASYYRLMADETDPVYGPFIQNTEMSQLIFLLWGKH